MLLAIAAIGSAAADALWLVLVPASLALFAGLGALGTDPVATLGVRVARLALGVLVLANGTVVVLGLRLEPAWLAITIAGAGALLVASLAWIGTVHAVRRGPRLWGGVLAAALPFGLFVDSVAARAARGVFFEGWGFRLGAGVLAVALVRLALGGRQAPA